MLFFAHQVTASSSRAISNLRMRNRDKHYRLIAGVRATHNHLNSVIIAMFKMGFVENPAPKIIYVLSRF
jgi:hypothetical protein